MLIGSLCCESYLLQSGSHAGKEQMQTQVANLYAFESTSDERTRHKPHRPSVFAYDTIR